MNKSRSLLSLLYLSSPALPIGAFAYSQGLESAIEQQWVTDEESLKNWLTGMLKYGLGKQDIPLFIRLYTAWYHQDLEAVGRWNQWVLATRESSELLLEEQQLGKSMLRLLASLQKISDQEKSLTLGYLASLTLAAQRFDLSVEDAALGWIWSWLENQVTVACKTIPLGQTQAQKVLMALMPLIPEILDQAFAIGDKSIGASLPGFAMISADHEQQYSRLFRS